MFQVTGGQMEVLNRKHQLVGDCGVGHQTVVCAESGTELVLQHLTEGVMVHALEVWVGLQIACYADLDGDPPVSDILTQLVNICLLVLNRRILNRPGTEEVETMPNPICIEVSDGLKDGLWSIRLTCMNGLFQKVLMGI